MFSRDIFKERFELKFDNATKFPLLQTQKIIVHGVRKHYTVPQQEKMYLRFFIKFIDFFTQHNDI